MAKRKPAIVIVLLLAFTCYVTTYIVYRESHIEVSEKDGNAYVIFPKEALVLYYFYRPLTYIDSVATGMRFHRGEHE